MLTSSLNSDRVRLVIESALQAGRSRDTSGITAVLASLRRVCLADGCVLWLWTKQGPPDETRLFAAAEDFDGTDDPFWHYLSKDSPSTRAARSGEPRNFERFPEDEIPADDPDRHAMKRLGVKSYCTIPVWWPNPDPSEKAIGAVTFYRRRECPFTEEEFELAKSLACLAPQLLADIVNHTSFHLLRHVSELLRTAPRPAEAELRCFPPEFRSTLTSVLSKVQETFNCLETAIYLKQPEDRSNTVYRVSSTWPWGLDRKAIETYASGEGLTGYCVKHERSVCIFDLGRFPEDLPHIQTTYPEIQWIPEFDMREAAREKLPANSDGKLPPLSFLAVPIPDHEGVLGVLRCSVVKSSPYYFNDRLTELLGLVAGLVGEWCRSYFRLRRVREQRQWLYGYVQGISALNQRAHEVLTGSKKEFEQLFLRALEAAHNAAPGAYGLSVHIADSDQASLRLGASDGRAWTAATPQATNRLKATPLLLKGKAPGSAAADAFQTNAMILVEDLKDSQYSCSLFPEVEAMIVAPISSGPKKFGVLGVLFDKKSQFSTQAVEVARLLGRQLGLYMFLADNIGMLQKTKNDLKERLDTEQKTSENLQHQLKTPVSLAHFYALQLNSRTSMANVPEVVLLKSLLRRTEQIVKNMGLFVELARDIPIRANRSGVKVTRVVERLQEAARDHNALLDPDRHVGFQVEPAVQGGQSESVVWLDMNLLDQMVDNLLDNAAKYSDLGSVVSVKAGLTQSGQFFFISVANHGRNTPIKPQNAKTLAERGQRGDTPVSRRQQGSGLGLYIVREFLAAHGGRLEIIPTNEKGITDVRLLFPTSVPEVLL